jgi:hypothetical protein
MKAVRNGGFDNGAVEFTTEGSVRVEFGIEPSKKSEGECETSFGEWKRKDDANKTKRN